MGVVVDHDERRVALAEAVFAVIRRDGINSASVRTVAREAGWTRGVIGHYFNDRDDLLLFAYRLALGNTCDRIREASAHLEPLDALTLALSRMLPVDEDSAVDFQIWLGFMGRVADRPDLGRAVLREHQQFRELVGDLVGRWIQRELPASGASVAEVASQLVVYVDGLGVATALDLEGHAPERLLDAIREHLAHCLIRLRAQHTQLE